MSFGNGDFNKMSESFHREMAFLAEYSGPLQVKKDGTLDKAGKLSQAWGIVVEFFGGTSSTNSVVIEHRFIQKLEKGYKNHLISEEDKEIIRAAAKTIKSQAKEKDVRNNHTELKRLVNGLFPKSAPFGKYLELDKDFSNYSVTYYASHKDVLAKPSLLQRIWSSMPFVKATDTTQDTPPLARKVTVSRDSNAHDQKSKEQEVADGGSVRPSPSVVDPSPRIGQVPKEKEKESHAAKEKEKEGEVQPLQVTSGEEKKIEVAMPQVAQKKKSADEPIQLEGIRKGESTFEGIDLLMKDSYLQDTLEKYNQLHGEPFEVIGAVPYGRGLQDPMGIKEKLSAEERKEVLLRIFLKDAAKSEKNLLIPIGNAAHWTALVIKKDPVELFHFDSLSTEEERKKNVYLQEALTVIKEAIGFKDAEITYNQSQHQAEAEEGWSCGFRVCTFAKNVVEGLPLDEASNEAKSKEGLESILNDYIREITEKGKAVPKGSEDFARSIEGYSNDQLVKETATVLRDLRLANKRENELSERIEEEKGDLKELLPFIAKYWDQGGSDAWNKIGLPQQEKLLSFIRESLGESVEKLTDAKALLDKYKKKNKASGEVDAYDWDDIPKFLGELYRVENKRHDNYVKMREHQNKLICCLLEADKSENGIEQLLLTMKTDLKPGSPWALAFDSGLQAHSPRERFVFAIYQTYYALHKKGITQKD